MSAAAPVRAGDLIAGKWRVDRVLGQGGMGVVVAAVSEAIGQRVAIKLLLPEALASPTMVQRFVREARAAGRLRSEHVARVYDAGQLDSGAPFIVMEHLDGGDLAELLAALGALPVATAVDLLLQAGEAIAE